MGRGRSGITDQSMRKPKIGKNRRRGTNFEIYNSPREQENHPPLLLADIVAQMRNMSPQEVKDLLIKSLAN